LTSFVIITVYFIIYSDLKPLGITERSNAATEAIRSAFTIT